MTSVTPSLRDCTSLIISTSETGAENVELAGSTLVEQSTKKPLGLDHLKLCKDESPNNCGAQTLTASRPNTLFLCVNDSFHRLGNFKGNIYLADAAPKLPDSLHPPNARDQLWPQQPSIDRSYARRRTAASPDVNGYRRLVSSPAAAADIGLS